MCSSHHAHDDGDAHAPRDHGHDRDDARAPRDHGHGRDDARAPRDHGRDRDDDARAHALPHHARELPLQDASSLKQGCPVLP